MRIDEGEPTVDLTQSGATTRRPISEEICSIVDRVLNSTPYKLYLFGSFARGVEMPSSDIDIAVEGLTPIPHRTMVQLRYCLEESNIPYCVDVVDLRAVSSELEREIRDGGILWRG